jgi:hypothetical protein
MEDERHRKAPVSSRGNRKRKSNGDIACITTIPTFDAGCAVVVKSRGGLSCREKFPQQCDLPMLRRKGRMPASYRTGRIDRVEHSPQGFRAGHALISGRKSLSLFPGIRPCPS